MNINLVNFSRTFTANNHHTPIITQNIEVPTNNLSSKDITELDSKILLGRSLGDCGYDRFHNYSVNERVLTDDLSFLKDKYGVDTIVDLRATHIEGENYKKEGEKAKELGMKYINLEMDGSIAPTGEQLSKFFNAVDNSKGKVYIHCHAGRDRTGMLAACYLTKTQQLDVETSFKRVFDERGVQRLKYMWGHPDEYQKLITTLTALRK